MRFFSSSSFFFSNSDSSSEMELVPLKTRIRSATRRDPAGKTGAGSSISKLLSDENVDFFRSNSDLRRTVKPGKKSIHNYIQ